MSVSWGYFRLTILTYLVWNVKADGIVSAKFKFISILSYQRQNIYVEYYKLWFFTWNQRRKSDVTKSENS